MGKAKAELEAIDVATMLAKLSIQAGDIVQLHVRRKSNGKFMVSLKTLIEGVNDNDEVEA